MNSLLYDETFNKNEKSSIRVKEIPENMIKKKIN